MKAVSYYIAKISIFHDGDSYHVETIPFICRANACKLGTSVMKELRASERRQLTLLSLLGPQLTANGPHSSERFAK